jgi:carboxyl-terminal processing protease
VHLGHLVGSPDRIWTTTYTRRAMRYFERLGRALVILGVFAVASYFALRFGTGGLWRGLEAAQAGAAPARKSAPYDLTQLNAVNETLKRVRGTYVEPGRVQPRQMFLSALNQIQRRVAQVIVLHEDKAATVKVRVDTEEKSFRVDNIKGHWDVSARLREVFVFLQSNLRDRDVDLREVEYAACNGMLRTLDPHSVYMSPQAYKDMTLSTTGHFGGLGIVISIRDQMLTVMRPMPGTPAGKAGLKRFDRIMKINNESTLNMPLDDAVQRLRGPAGSKVTIWVQRDGEGGWTGWRPFELEREEINIKSVESRALGGGVGYIRIRQFQGSTADELDKALEEVQSKGRLQSLVLDLRSNPGGLLDQATKVADRFLTDGMIVATVGGREGREVKHARPSGAEPTAPIVVIVDGQSASASEIVAGALKNLDRAVVIGQTTFGKGTVQMVYPDMPEGAALKLTVAQYLTPGDVSIQGVGVPPDIELDPMTADMLEMDLFRPEDLPRERDLNKSLFNAAQRTRERPFFTLRYNLPESERARMRDEGEAAEDQFRLDFPIRFAQKLAAALEVGPRAKVLRAARPLLDQVQQAELTAVSADLARFGIDWGAPSAGQGEGPRAGDFAVSVETDRKDHTVVAGEPMSMKVTVTNKGKEPIYQLRAVTKSDGEYYDAKELVFGKLMPGESRSATAPMGFCDVDGRKPGSTRPLPQDAKRVCVIPKDAVLRQDVVKVRFYAEGGEPPAEAEIRPTIQSLPRPVFAYTYQIVDNRPGNGDGQLARGEGATVYLTVKNVGTGRSYETQANIRNLAGNGLLLHAGRFDVSGMKPGETRDVAFTFDVLQALEPNVADIELSVVDRDLRVASVERLSIPITKTGLALADASGRGRTAASVAVRGQPVASAPVVAQLYKASVVEQLGRFGDFTKVRLGGARFGFVETAALKPVQAPLSLKLEPRLSHSPPVLEVLPASLATRDRTVHIEGVATDSDRVLDAYIFVGDRKVFYRSNRKGTEPGRLRFSLDAELQPGINVIHVIARESEDTLTRHTMVVRRDGPGGEALATPKRELSGTDWEFAGPEE